MELAKKKKSPDNFFVIYCSTKCSLEKHTAQLLLDLCEIETGVSHLTKLSKIEQSTKNTKHRIRTKKNKIKAETLGG